MSIKEKYTVRIIDSFLCKEWIIKKHYAHRIPPVEYSFGLYDRNNILIGITTYGTPLSSGLRDIFSNEFKVIELNRLCINDDSENNCLSFLVSYSLRLLPKPICVVSYADTAHGHHGYIYQATNFIYTGLSAKRTDWKIKGLEHLHGATISDLSRGKENRSEWMKEKYGEDFYLEERSRKHRYFYFLGNKKQVINMKQKFPYKIVPYPKGDNKRYDASFKPTIQQQLF